MNSNESLPITVLDLALHRGAQTDDAGGVNGAEFERVGLPIMGSCEVCGATVAAYNACPSTSGYLRCASGCICDDGWSDVAAADRAIFGEDAAA